MLGGLLLHLLPQTRPYEVVIDRTEWYFGETPVNVLVVGIVHGGNGVSNRVEGSFE